MIATSDDLGKVNLFRYPCVHPEKAQCVSYAGHSSHVMNVRWTVADEYLISCGGNDKCLMQWRHTMADAGQSTSSDSTTLESANDEASEGIESESTSDSAVESSDDWLGSLLDIEPGGGDESGAVKPWLGAIRAPKNPPPISADAPAIQLDLEWVHGYTTGAVAGVRIASNLKYNLDHNFVYTAAALGVLLDRSHYTPVNENQNSSRAKDINKQLLEQSFFQGHDNDVLCLTISRDRRYIATGQAASITMKGRGSIIVWDSIQCRILCRMDGCHQRAVTSLAFNTEGNQLLSVGKDDNNTHTLWCDAGGGWSRFQQLATSRGDRSPVSVHLIDFFLLLL